MWLDSIDNVGRQFQAKALRQRRKLSKAATPEERVSLEERAAFYDLVVQECWRFTRKTRAKLAKRAAANGHSEANLGDLA